VVGHPVADPLLRFRRRRLDQRAELLQERLRRIGRSRDVSVGVFGHFPDLSESRSSARRSMDSFEPSCIPEATMPSRSMTDWNTIWATSRVLLPRSSKVAVCRATWPGTPSYSNVATILSGAT